MIFELIKTPMKLALSVTTIVGLLLVNATMTAHADGAQWTSVAAPAANQWNSVAHGNGVWIGVSSDGTNRVMRSTDNGLNWTATAAAEPNYWRSVAYGNGVWISVSLDGTNRIMRSLDPVSQNPDYPRAALQQFGVPADTHAQDCAQLAPNDVNWPGLLSLTNASWSISWADWVDDRAGGTVCTRQPYYTGTGWATR